MHQQLTSHLKELIQIDLRSSRWILQHFVVSTFNTKKKKKKKKSHYREKPKKFLYFSLLKKNSSFFLFFWLSPTCRFFFLFVSRYRINLSLTNSTWFTYFSKNPKLAICGQAKTFFFLLILPLIKWENPWTGSSTYHFFNKKYQLFLW